MNTRKLLLFCVLILCFAFLIVPSLPIRKASALFSKSWGRQCQQGLCFAGNPTTWCEDFYPNGCQGGDVGDIQIMQKTESQIEESTTKFYGRLNPDGLQLERVGFLSGASMRVGDTLLSVSEGLELKRLINRNEYMDVLTWKFNGATVYVRFKRDGQEHIVAMPNPVKVQ